MSEITERQAVVAEALSWIGTPYVNHGRVKGAGADCAMLPAEVYEATGMVEHVDVGYYSPMWHLNRKAEKFLETVEKYADRVESPLPGDMVIYKFGKAFAHGAIVVKWPKIVHAVLNLSVIEDDGDSPVLAIDPRHGPRERVFYRLKKWCER